jgi:hypothetical protein
MSLTRGFCMVHQRLSPLDSQNIIQEIQKVATHTEKIVVHRLEQGEDFFKDYSFKEAILELDELFDS